MYDCLAAPSASCWTCSSFLVFCFFFFKQKTAYEMRISDWSSDVCSSDLCGACALVARQSVEEEGREPGDEHQVRIEREPDADQIGRASCRERVCQYV